MKTYLLVAMYLFAVACANLSAYLFGPWASVLNAFLFIGFDLSSRDSLHERWTGSGLFLRMTLLIFAGSALSWLIDSGARNIALASAISFLASGFIDFGAYQILHHRARLVKVNGSNVFSSLADSLIFPTLAFGSFMLPIVLAQFAMKMVGGFVFSLILRRKK